MENGDSTTTNNIDAVVSYCLQILKIYFKIRHFLDKT